MAEFKQLWDDIEQRSLKTFEHGIKTGAQFVRYPSTYLLHTQGKPMLLYDIYADVSDGTLWIQRDLTLQEAKERVPKMLNADLPRIEKQNPRVTAVSVYREDATEQDDWVIFATPETYEEKEED